MQWPQCIYFPTMCLLLSSGVVDISEWNTECLSEPTNRISLMCWTLLEIQRWARSSWCSRAIYSYSFQLTLSLGTQLNFGFRIHLLGGHFSNPGGGRVTGTWQTEATIGMQSKAKMKMFKKWQDVLSGLELGLKWHEIWGQRENNERGEDNQDLGKEEEWGEEGGGAAGGFHGNLKAKRPGQRMVSNREERLKSALLVETFRRVGLVPCGSRGKKEKRNLQVTHLGFHRDGKGRVMRSWLPMQKPRKSEKLHGNYDHILKAVVFLVVM